VLQPLVSAGIFSFVFGKVANLPSDGVPYFLFAFVGLQAWALFNNTLNKSNNSLLANAHLVSKVYFPRLILPLSTLPSTLLDFVVAMAMLVVLMAIYHVAPGWGLITLPLWLLLITMLAMGVGLITASLAVSFRDVNYILPVATQFLMYGSPVAYAVSAVPAKYKAVYFLNPLSGLLEGFRWSVMNRGHLNPGVIAYSACFAVAVFVLGLFAFRRMEKRFADVI
jgi:lipopolysaccharide transport system permease protein